MYVGRHGGLEQCGHSDILSVHGVKLCDSVPDQKCMDFFSSLLASLPLVSPTSRPPPPLHPPPPPLSLSAGVSLAIVWIQGQPGTLTWSSALRKSRSFVQGLTGKSPTPHRFMGVDHRGWRLIQPQGVQQERRRQNNLEQHPHMGKQLLNLQMKTRGSRSAPKYS
jgi:hypothetical protein